MTAELLLVGQLAEFTNQCVLIDAREPLNGMFRQPARLSDVHLSAQPAQLESEPHNHNQRPRIVGLGIGQGRDGKRCLAARPKSTIQTSPARASIFAKGFFPHLACSAVHNNRSGWVVMANGRSFRSSTCARKTVNASPVFIPKREKTFFVLRKRAVGTRTRKSVVVDMLPKCSVPTSVAGKGDQTSGPLCRL